MLLETLKEKIEHVVHHGEEIADAEFRKVVGEVLALFHEHVTGEAIAPKPEAAPEEEAAPATVAAPEEHEAPEATPESVGGQEDGTAA